MALYDLLEKQIAPQFYDRGVDNLPREWITRMKNCMRKLAPQFSTNRMVRRLLPAILCAGDHPRATPGRESAGTLNCSGRGENTLRSRWGTIKIVGVHSAGDGHYKVGQSVQVEALVDLGTVTPKETERATILRPTSAWGILKTADDPDATRREMAPGRHLFVGTIDCRTSGRQGFAVRIPAGNPDLATPFEPGLILWN